ncbi:9156_t:CDS:2 [Funneliformis caledonium]|uniref:9156_t:CDS:1 n=1 Tax=Funneliformis caledonium TaxID=1117310 RepID=A0A9N9DLG4_9GLOM|nr:9156_t:CDS:2 [Funneliformis caledonium]
MFKIYSILPPPINKFAGFILYGLLSVALITLAQEDTIANNNCKVPLEPVPVENKQITIGYVRLFGTGQPKIPWNNYDYINVIAYPQDGGGDWYSIFRQDENKLKPIDDLVKDKINANPSTKILLSIRDYDVVHDLDGIDIEYPGMRGSLCKSPWDKRNDDKFINFLKDLRLALNETGSDKILMLTVGRDIIGNLKDEIENINFLNIETYHNSLYQNLKTPDDNNYRSYPNSPLNAYQAAYLAWIGAGINSNKIIMGVDFGNTIQMIVDNGKTIEKSQTVNFQKNVVFDVNRLGLEAQTKRIKYPCGDVNDNNQMKLYSWSWKHLSNSTLDPKSGYCNIINNNIQFNWTRNFDQVDESKTPWLYSAFSPDNTPNYYLYVSYEDFVSLSLKLEFAKNNLVGGISISDVTFDDDKNNLLNFMQPIRGKSTVGSSSPSNGSGNGKSKSNPNDSVIPKKNKAGLIAGSVIGVIFGLALFGSCAYMYRQKILLKSEAGDIKTKGAHTTSKIEMASEQSPNRFGSPTTVLPVASGHVTAMFDFIGKEENDLSFKKGDVIEVLEKGDGPNDWWVGRVNGIVGEFPGNYVKET